MSRLAVASLVVAILTCPIWLGPLCGGLWDALRYFGLVISPSFFPGWAFLVILGLPPAAALVALVRIKRSAGRRRGAGMAIAALAVSACWWGLVAVVDMLLRAGYMP